MRYCSHQLFVSFVVGLLTCRLEYSCGFSTTSSSIRKVSSSLSSSVFVPLTLQHHVSSSQRKSSRSRSRSSGLRMHMGHSHSHHHHHDHNHNNNSSSSGGVISWKQYLNKQKMARLCFAGLATWGCSYSRGIRSWKGALSLFVLLSGLMLGGLDQLRGEVMHMWSKGMSWMKGIVKHGGTKTRSLADEKRNSAVDRVTWWGIWTNVLLSVGKFIVGLKCHSSVLIADAGHSLSDLLSDFVTLWAVRIGRLPPDEDHPYGHGKFEAIGSLFLSMLLFGTAMGVGHLSLSKLTPIFFQTASSVPVEVPTYPALIMAALSIGSKEWLFQITKQMANAIHSPVLLANAWHHRSDAYSSILALMSIALAMTSGWVAIDALAGVLVGAMIGMTGADIFATSLQQLTDASDDTLEQKVRHQLHQHDPDIVLMELKTRPVGAAQAHVDLELESKSNLSASALTHLEKVITSQIQSLPHDDPSLPYHTLTATVQVSTPDQKNLVACPLLLHQQHDHAHHNHDHHHHQSSPLEEFTSSTTYIQEEARQTLQLFPSLKLQDLQVHYTDSIHTSVHVYLSSDSENITTIDQYQTIAQDIQNTLVQSSNVITDAKVYLNLLQPTQEKQQTPTP